MWAYEKGLVSGGIFGASVLCTRVETVTYLWKLTGSPPVSTPSSFTDVPTGADHTGAVAYAVEKAITSGTGSEQFSPHNTCACEQIVTFLYRALKK